MSVTVNGNHSKAFLGTASSGNGTQNVPQGMGWVAVTASTIGDTHVVQLSSLVMSDITQGIYFQSEAAASVQFTLANSALATSRDPAINASTVWGNTTPLTAATIVKAPVLFTCVKITFTAPGTVYIGVR